MVDVRIKFNVAEVFEAVVENKKIGIKALDIYIRQQTYANDIHVIRE